MPLGRARGRDSSACPDPVHICVNGLRRDLAEDASNSGLTFAEPGFGRRIARSGYGGNLQMDGLAHSAWSPRQIALTVSSGQIVQLVW